ncbi:hypothetical protein FB451DRAFT_1194774 [Mycena latifolia]|nr:hypothetical protein FB451DRAFT_1194774 [Mycena latifolia]
MSSLWTLIYTAISVTLLHVHCTEAVGTPTVTGSGSALTSVPSAPTGSQNTVIDVSTSTDIVWNGDWTTVQSSCTSGSKARSITGTITAADNVFMQYSFTGSAIYLSVSSFNAQYSVLLDSTDLTLFGTPLADAPANCTFGWARMGLTAKKHSVKIDVALPSSARRDIDLPMTLEIQNLVITQPASSSSNGSSTGIGGGQAAGGGTGGASQRMNPTMSLTILNSFLSKDNRISRMQVQCISLVQWNSLRLEAGQRRPVQKQTQQ